MPSPKNNYIYLYIGNTPSILMAHIYTHILYIVPYWASSCVSKSNCSFYYHATSGQSFLLSLFLMGCLWRSVIELIFSVIWLVCFDLDICSLEGSLRCSAGIIDRKLVGQLGRFCSGYELSIFDYIVDIAMLNGVPFCPLQNSLKASTVELSIIQIDIILSDRNNQDNCEQIGDLLA